jgi:hypothetical protein
MEFVSKDRKAIKSDLDSSKKGWNDNRPKPTEKDLYMKAVNEMKRIVDAIAEYTIDNKDFPEAKDIRDLKSKITPFHIKTFSTEDPWGTPLKYKRVNKNDYYLISGGSDKKVEDIKFESYDKLSGQDIVFFNGELTRGPKFAGIRAAETEKIIDKNCMGMTWIVKRRIGPYVCVGSDKITNPYRGDTSIQTELPILAICKINLPRPNEKGMKYNYYYGWSGAKLKLTPPVKGTLLTSREEADRIVQQYFPGYRMAEFHDGGGGWSFWGKGELSTSSRFWVYINDQRGNPWNSCTSRR